MPSTETHYLRSEPPRFQQGQRVRYIHDGRECEDKVVGTIQATLGNYYLIGHSAKIICQSKVLQAISA